MVIFCIFHIVKIILDEIQNNKNKNSKNNVIANALSKVIISLYIIIYCGLCMIFVTGLFIFHSRLILKNATTKEELKHFWKNPQGNPYKRKSKKTNIYNSLFPLIKKYSLLDIFNMNKNKIINNNDNDNDDNKETINVSINKNIIQNNNTINNNNDNKESMSVSLKAENGANLHKSVVNNIFSNVIDTSTKIQKNKINISMGYNDKNNYISPFDLKIEINDENNQNGGEINNNENKNGNKFSDLNKKVEKKNNENSDKRYSAFSDYSENITIDDQDRKIPSFKANFGSEEHNIDVRPADYVIKRIYN